MNKKSKNFNKNFRINLYLEVKEKLKLKEINFFFNLISILKKILAIKYLENSIYEVMKKIKKNKYKIYLKNMIVLIFWT